MEPERLPYVQDMILIAGQAESGNRARQALVHEIAEASGRHNENLRSSTKSISPSGIVTKSS